jgi:hypothetical protein
MATLPFIPLCIPRCPRVAPELCSSRARNGQFNYGNRAIARRPILRRNVQNAVKIDIVNVPQRRCAGGHRSARGQVVHISHRAPQFRTYEAGSCARSPSPLEAFSGASGSSDHCGVRFPEIDVVGWNGVHVPAKTPRATIDKINAAIADVLKSREMKERMIASGFDLVATTVEEFDAFVKRDVERYAKVIKESHIRVD